MHEQKRIRTAFSLMEMLVVMAVITLLISLLMPAMGKARESGRRVKCLSNQGQIMDALIIHADEDADGVYLPTSNYTVDDVSMIIPKIISDRNIAVCPSTQHTAEVLTASYGSPKASTRFSYEMFSWRGRGTYPDGTVIFGAGQANNNEIMTNRNVKQPSEAWIPMDDSSGEGDNNWPNRGNHHGAEGLNLGFVDGHAGWHTREQYVIAAIKSYHPWFGNNNTCLPLAQSVVPNVNNVGGWHGSWWYD